MQEYQFFARKKVSRIARWVSALLHVKIARMVHRTISDCQPSVLEIGPGKGAFATQLKTLSAEILYHAYEPESQMCLALKKQGFSVSSERVPPIPDKDATYSDVIMLNVLEHMHDLAEAREIIKEIHRVLRVGGHVFLSFPSFLDWKADFYNLDYTHRFPTTELNVSQLLNDAGFKVQSINHQYGCFTTDFGRIPNFLLKSFRVFATFILPRSISRTEKIQKMAILFAENIFVIGIKEP